MGVGIWIHLHYEVVFEEDETNDRKEVDKDDSQHCSQDNGAAVTCNRLDDIQKCLFAIYHIQKL